MSEPKVNFSDADLELLLAEADREDPILREGRPGNAERRGRSFQRDVFRETHSSPGHSRRLASQRLSSSFQALLRLFGAVG